MSVVVPVLDGVEHLPEFTRRLTTSLRSTPWTHQIVLVDDGSTDGTWSFIGGLAEARHDVVGVRLRRNVGQAAAVGAGFTVATGEIVVTMDVDLETFPEDLPLLVAPVADGVDLASGCRTGPRQLRRLLPSRIFNAHVRRRGIPLRDLGCGMNAMTASIAADYVRFGSIGRGLQKSLLVSLAGSFVEVPLRSVRTSGSRFSFGGLVDLWVEFDALHTSPRPARRPALGACCIAVGAAGLRGSGRSSTRRSRVALTLSSVVALVVGTSVLAFSVRVRSATRRLRRTRHREFEIAELVGAVGDVVPAATPLRSRPRSGSARAWAAATAAVLDG